jgi:hypothetical protein
MAAWALEYQSSISLVHDVDDTRAQTYGVYYTQKKPVELGKLKPL